MKHSTTPDGIPDDQEVPTAFEKPDVGRMITSLVLIETIALIAICLTVGKIVAQLLAGTVFELPTFVCVLFVGVIVSNGLALLGFTASLNVPCPLWATSVCRCSWRWR